MEQWRTFLLHDNGTAKPTNISASIEKCSSHYQVYHIVWATSEILSAIVGFPGCVIIQCKIAQRHLLLRQRGRGSSCSSFATSSDLLFVSLCLIGILNSVAMLLHAFESLSSAFHLPPYVLRVLNTVVFTAGPPNMTSICLHYYLAMVHPLRYSHLKTKWRYPLILTALIWLYTIVIETIIIVQNLPTNNYICIGTFVVAFPTVLFLNVSMLRALRLAGPRRRRLADLCPAKRQAFLVVLSILVSNVMYCLPQIILYTYEHMVDTVSFTCVVFPIVMVFPTVQAAVMCLLLVFTQTGVKLCGIKR